HVLVERRHLRAKCLEWVERSRLQLVREDVLPLCRPHRRAFAENANECQPGEVRSRACPSGCPPGAAERVQARQRPGGKAPLDQVPRPLRSEAGGVAEPAMDRERKIVDKCGVGGPLTTTTGHGSSRWEAPRPCLFPLVSWTPAQPPPSPRPRPSRAASRPCRPRPSSP